MGKISFSYQADKDERECLKAFRVFYGLTTQTKVFQQMMMFTVFEIAGKKEDKTWSKPKRRAWLYCIKQVGDLYQLMKLRAMESVLKGLPKDTKLTVKELQVMAKEKMKC